MDIINAPAPLIHHASVHPDKVLPGDVMTVTAEVSSGTDIISVTADMGGIETISLRLLEGSPHNGTWQADWLVHDTEFRAYVTTVTATNSIGENSSYAVNWSDDPGWYNANWAYRKQITIDHAKVNVTSLSNTSDTVLYMYYNNLNESGAAANSTKDAGVGGVRLYMEMRKRYNIR